MTATATIRIVLADDDDLVREMLSGLLEDLGYHVVSTSADGRSAIDQCLAVLPDVVLLDHRMPRMSGAEAALELHDRLPGLPVIILSAYDDAGLQQAARRSGVFRYLVKGCTATEISDAITAAVAARVSMPTAQAS